MSDLHEYIERRKKTDPEFAEGFDAGYEAFKVGALLRQAREEAGLTKSKLLRSSIQRNLPFPEWKTMLTTLGCQR